MLNFFNQFFLASLRYHEFLMRGVRAVVTFYVVTILCDVHVVCVAIGYPTLFVSDAIVYDAIERVKFCA